MKLPGRAPAFSVAVTSYSPAVCGGGSSATRYVPSPRSLTFESATGGAPPGGFSVASHASPPAGRGTVSYTHLRAPEP